MLLLGPHVLHWSSLEPPLALLRWDLDEITPQKICGSTAPLKAALSVNFKKKRKMEKQRGGKEITGQTEKRRRKSSKRESSRKRKQEKK